MDEFERGFEVCVHPCYFGVLLGELPLMQALHGYSCKPDAPRQEPVDLHNPIEDYAYAVPELARGWQHGPLDPQGKGCLGWCACPWP